MVVERRGWASSGIGCRRADSITWPSLSPGGMVFADKVNAVIVQAKWDAKQKGKCGVRKGELIFIRSNK